MTADRGRAEIEHVPLAYLADGRSVLAQRNVVRMAEVEELRVTTGFRIGPTSQRSQNICVGDVAGGRTWMCMRTVGPLERHFGEIYYFQLRYDRSSLRAAVYLVLSSAFKRVLLISSAR